MFVKTTKGVYELTPNRVVEIIEAKESKHEELVEYYHYEKNPMKRRISRLYGEVVAQSDNLGELIDVACFVNKNNKNQRHFYHPKIVDSQLYQEEYCHEMIIVIGMIWCGDDLVKVADWDNDKGEWKLYER